MWQFDYDKAKQELTNPRPLIDMRDVFPGQNIPEPEGLAVSEEGLFYHVVFWKSLVICYHTSVKVHHKHTFTAVRLTFTALCARNDNKLFVTSTQENFDDFDVKINAHDKSGDLGVFYSVWTCQPRQTAAPKQFGPARSEAESVLSYNVIEWQKDCWIWWCNGC